MFSSSAAVYGDEPTLPKPISPYGYEKLIGEQYMKLYSELYDVETVSLRYFNVYGERQSTTSDYSGVISIFKNNEIYMENSIVKDANIKAMNTPNILCR